MVHGTARLVKPIGLTGPAKWTKLAQTIHHHKNFNLLGSVQYIHARLVVNCCLLNCALMVKNHINSYLYLLYDATNLKDSQTLCALFAGPVTNVHHYLTTHCDLIT